MPVYAIKYNYKNGTGKTVRGEKRHSYRNLKTARKDADMMNRLDPSCKAKAISKYKERK